jgi:hypothetical protein
MRVKASLAYTGSGADSHVFCRCRRAHALSGETELQYNTADPVGRSSRQGVVDRSDPSALPRRVYQEGQSPATLILTARAE